MVGGSGEQSFSRTQPQVMPSLLEAGTLNTPGLAGLAAALDFLQAEGLDKVHARESELTERFYRAASALPGITIYGDFSGDRAAIVALNIAGVPADVAAQILDEEFDIAVRAGAHCAPLMHQALGTNDCGALRFSFSYFTKDGDIEAALEALRQITSN